MYNKNRQGVLKMKMKKKQWSRRDFLKTAGAIGVGSIIPSLDRSAHAAGEPSVIPRRPFGKTGVEVSILSLGGIMNIESKQLLLKQAVNRGITYWDTAHSYEGGRSERGIGKYLSKYPEDREKIFLVTKSGAWTTKGMSAELDTSLERMKTDYIDLFFVHGIDHINEIDDDHKKWAQKAKAAGKIRFFGFSTHSNMEGCLLGAARLGWIDGIMMTYNFRLMHTDRMRQAVDACAEAGIGLTAMKVRGGGQVKTDTDTELRLAGRFLKKGFTENQAKLKAIWENPNIASICYLMPNMNVLLSSAAAAMNKTKLSMRERELLQQYARQTRSDYCAGCTDICESRINSRVPVGDVMRYLMYARVYGDLGRAKTLYYKIPGEIRTQMAGLDYSAAEKNCPQRMRIGRLMREAVVELA
jgi:predicted aldo/keto reductase-like oxidoreductase